MTNSPFRRLALALLAWFGTAMIIPACADEVRYTFTDPGADWAAPTFDAHDWKTASDLPALAQVWHDATEPVLWVRLTQDMAWQQINNSYFRAAHDGALEIFVNGKSTGNNAKPAPKPQDIRVNPVGNEVVGRNVFGLHFTAGTGVRDISVEHVIGQWVPVEERVVHANPVLQERTRDSEACLGPDGNYYLAATSGPPDFFSGPHA